MNRISAAGLLILAIVSCNPEKDTAHSLKTGIWRAVVEMQGQELPFNFEVVNDRQSGYDVYILNGEERLLLDEVTIKEDSVSIGLHIFDADFKAKIKDDSLVGLFIKNYDQDFKIPFRAAFGQSFRFKKDSDATNIPDFNGKYEVTFFDEGDTTEAIGIFKQSGDSVTGTFLTPTGDYRYLQGNVVNDVMQLSTFDGNHAYIFTATKNTEGELSGMFYSGKSHQETWTGKKNGNATLPDPESLTYLKKEYDKIEFSFPDVNGKKINLSDEKYKNKVVILQLFGTWCPNCMDETRFLTSWYKENKDRDIEIIGLAYERKDDFNYASSRVRKMIEKYGVDYDFVIAGVNDKDEAAATLPMLNKVVAFPTTIFIGKDGKVKKIHTGFSGPGTGIYYEQFVLHFNETVNELLK